jgi:hypothetical protein
VSLSQRAQESVTRRRKAGLEAGVVAHRELRCHRRVARRSLCRLARHQGNPGRTLRRRTDPTRWERTGR